MAPLVRYIEHHGIMKGYLITARRTGRWSVTDRSGVMLCESQGGHSYVSFC